MRNRPRASLSRRKVLAGLAAIASGIGLPASAARAGEANATEVLLSLLDDRAKAAAVGSAWLRSNAAAPAPDAVLNGLTESLRQQGWDGGIDRDDLRVRLAAAVQADFRNGATVSVEGWEIARTQAELCALAYFATAGLI
jgi:hypothetical protein